MSRALESDYMVNNQNDDTINFGRTFPDNPSGKSENRHMGRSSARSKDKIISPNISSIMRYSIDDKGGSKLQKNKFMLEPLTPIKEQGSTTSVKNSIR